MAWLAPEHVAAPAPGERASHAYWRSVEAAAGGDEPPPRVAAPRPEPPPPAPPPPARDGITAALLERMAAGETHAWREGTACIREVADDARRAVRPVLDAVQNRDAALADVLAAATELLQQHVAVWHAAHGAQRTPLAFLHGVLEHAQLDTVPAAALCRFCAAFLDSVAAHAPAAYDESLKVTMNTLLEQKQQQHVPAHLRAQYVAVGAQLLLLRLASALDAALAADSSPSERITGDRSVGAVLDLYAPRIVSESSSVPLVARCVGVALAYDAVRLWRETSLLLSAEADAPLTLAYYLRAMSLVAPLYPAPAVAALLPSADAGGGAARAQTESAAVALRQCMAAMRDAYTEFAESRAVVNPPRVCVGPAVGLLACGDAEMRAGTQALLRIVTDDLYTRVESVHALFHQHGADAVAGMQRFFAYFLLLAETLRNAAPLASATVQVIDDVLHVLCDQSIGLLLAYIEWEQRAVPGAVAAVWDGLSRSLAAIFAGVPAWSRVADRKELVAWLAQVPVVASYMAKHCTLVAPLHAGADAALTRVVVESLWRPVDGAVKWLRLNHAELLQQLYDYLRRTLVLLHRERLALPDAVVDAALEFLRAQLAVASPRERKTLLSTSQLELLAEEFHALKRAGVARTPRQGTEGGRLRQQKLTFAAPSGAASAPSAARPRAPVVDLTHTDSTAQLASRSQFRPARTEPRHRLPPAARSLPPAKAPAPSKLGQLRNEFQLSRNAARRPHAPTRSLEVDEIRAPLAVSSVTGAVKAPPPRPQPPPPRARSDDEGTSSSDDEDSSSSDGRGASGDGKGASGLQSLLSPTKRRPVVKAPVRRSVKLMEDPAVLEAVRREQERKRHLRLRAPVPLTALYAEILAWPVGAGGARPPHIADTGGARIPPTFESPAQYEDVFLPLLQLEAWAEFQQGQEQLAEQPRISLSICTQGKVDKLTQMRCTVNGRLPPQYYLNDTDVVHMELAPCTAWPHGLQFLAHVTDTTTRQHGRDARTEVVVQCVLSDAQLRPGQPLVGRDGWSLRKLFSVATLAREYAALRRVGDLDLVTDILRAHVAAPPALREQDVAAAVRAYDVNASQARAVLSVPQMRGFALVQGPPGTGKTKTIRALVAQYMRAGGGARGAAPAASGAPAPKLLVCAPSNAAIDEIVVRLSGGVHVDGKRVAMRIVRLGRLEMTHPAARACAMEQLVDDVASGKKQRKAEMVEELQRLRAQAAQMAQVRDGAGVASTARRQLQAEMDALADTIFDLQERADSLFASGVGSSRREQRREVLRQADVVCGTLSSVGADLLADFAFHTVIIDEAVQAVELTALIPLRYGCERCVLIGDPKQLPPTVISRDAEDRGYAQSLFVRLYARAADRVHLLNTQYRMHPDISVFPSLAFYDGRLRDGPDMGRAAAQPWHRVALLGPCRILDTGPTREAVLAGHSLQNEQEADTALRLYEVLRQHVRGGLAGRVGFVSMYKAQVRLLRTKFQRRFGRDLLDTTEFSSVDGYQGQERDIIILSCVRSNKHGGIGFLSDQRRLNVALTRARFNLFVIGDAAGLEHASAVWARLIRAARERNFLVHATPRVFDTPASALAVREKPTLPAAPHGRPAPGTQRAAVPAPVPPPPAAGKRRAEDAVADERPRQILRAADHNSAPPGVRASAPSATAPEPRPATPAPGPSPLLATPQRLHKPRKSGSNASTSEAPIPASSTSMRASGGAPNQAGTEASASCEATPGKWAQIVARARDKKTELLRAPAPATKGKEVDQKGPAWLRPSRRQS
ncbi:hypothetical protein MSPP1_001980 [Malassezia sp. CBS 17886]|nr:hypothetical protein MSPP1_001980 [Malassezia sp. CBS 17886]